MEEKQLIRSILGPRRRNIKELVYAIQEAGELLFIKRIAMDDICVMKDIYPNVARKMGKGIKTVSRQIERLGNLCWEELSREDRQRYIGKELRDIQGPRDMIFYLAFYVHFQKSYYEVIREWPELLFSEEDLID